MQVRYERAGRTGKNRFPGETLEQEQADNRAQMQAITDELRIASSADNDVRRFIGEIREYAPIKKLDEAILNRLIDKIFISAV